MKLIAELHRRSKAVCVYIAFHSVCRHFLCVSLAFCSFVVEWRCLSICLPVVMYTSVLGFQELPEKLDGRVSTHSVKKKPELLAYADAGTEPLFQDFVRTWDSFLLQSMQEGCGNEDTWFWRIRASLLFSRPLES